jgi:quercetin dioxygenase-like cupin family protein
VSSIREGERISGEGGLGVTLLVDIEEIGVVDVRSAPGRVAPPSHVHALHAEALLVLAGELTFELEDGEHAVGPDTWVFVPPGVVHTFAVTGEEQAHFLDFHVPGSGLGDFVRGLHAATSDEELRAVRAAFDQQPPPEGGGADPGLVVVSRAGDEEGDRITDRPDRRATVLVETDELTISEFHYGAGQRGAKPHVHREHADAFLVLEGEFTFHLRDGAQALPAGTLLVLPSGVVHGFDNDSTGHARCFNFHMPSFGFADYMRGRNPGFDQHDPPEDGGVDPEAVVVTRLA